MKLCTCNNCEGIFEDKNPKDDAKEFAAHPGISPLIIIRDGAESDGDRFEEYWGCPNCGTDQYLSDKVDERELSFLREGIYWILTDFDTGQYGRRLSTYKYEFKEDEKPKTVIDLEKYTWREICDCCESYYENMDELFKQYGPQSTWIIAECLFEMGVIKT